MNAITHYLALFSIRQKLWGGFAVLLAILVLVATNTLLNLSSTQADIESVTQDIQPTLIASSDLRVQLKDTASALGFFLLTKQKIHKDTYHQGLEKLDSSLERLKNSPLVQKDPAILEMIETVGADVAKFKGYEAQMLNLADSLTDNYFALGFAGGKMNPINQDVAQIVANMVQSEREESASGDRRRLLLKISELRYIWANVINNVRIYLFYGNDDALSNVRLFYSGVKDLIDKIAEEQDILTFEQEEAIAPLREKVVKWGEYLEELVAIQQSDKTRMDAYLIKTELGPILARVDERLGTLDSQLREQTERTGNAMIEHANTTTAIVKILLLTGLVVGVMLAWIITRVIAQPVDSAALAMEDIAEGEGDLTQRLQVNGRDEIAHLATGFNQFVDKIQAVIRQVSEAVGQVSKTASELTMATQKANQVTEQQKQETTQIATAVTQMSANAQEVARHAEMAAQAANQVDKETQEGQRIVAEALEGIRSLVDDTQMAADAVGKLGVDIEDIGSVIAMIGGITDQTNLLALNAAIEAARAGEQGRGFAVVADEVRTLAERTKQSTNEIRGRIETLQSHAHDAVNQMNRNREVAQNTSLLAGRAGESLQSITQSVSSINDMTHQIASSAEEQSTVANEVNNNVCNITRLADDADSATNSVAVNCESLEQLSVTLNGLVGKFKT